MDRRKEANRVVKEKITRSLFSLMREKPLSEISITEVVTRAGVARSSFYRNYDSKEDVMRKLIWDVLEQFREEIHRETPEEFYCFENVLLSFRYFEKWEGYCIDIVRSSFGAMLLDTLNQFHESVAGSMPANSIDRYQLYIYIGALFDTAMVWLQDGKRETAEEMAEMFCRYMRI